MDTHPTPFPGKRRPAAANPAKKDRDWAKPSTQPAPPPRQKRAFGIARSTNIPNVEKPLLKPLPAKTSRPWKPSGTATQKVKVGIERNQLVCFQKPEKEGEAESCISIEKSLQDEGDRTPASSLIKAVAAGGTPYQTAENCSKCRFDKLETSVYWLAQIKIAESVAKHFVSAAFFRLALECHAQPFLSLQSELKHYVARHKSISSEIKWNDLCKVYGLSNERSSAADPGDLDKFDAVLVEQEDSKLEKQDEANSETLKDECFEFEIIDNPAIDVSEKETSELIDNNLTVTSDEISTEGFVDVKAMRISSKDTGELKSLERNVSGKKSEKSKVSSSDKSLSSTRARRSGGSSGKGREVLNQHEAGLKISGGKPLRNTVGGKLSRNIQLRNQGKEDRNITSPSFRNDVNLEGVLEDANCR